MNYEKTELSCTILLLLSQEEVASGEGGSEEIISELLPYDIVGDVSVVCNVPQPHTVRVCELCSVLRIDKQSLTSILQIYFKDSRQILSNLLKVTCQQQRVWIKTWLQMKICFSCSGGKPNPEGSSSNQTSHTWYQGKKQNLFSEWTMLLTMETCSVWRVWSVRELILVNPITMEGPHWYVNSYSNCNPLFRKNCNSEYRSSFSLKQMQQETHFTLSENIK